MQNEYKFPTIFELETRFKQIIHSNLFLLNKNANTVPGQEKKHILDRSDNLNILDTGRS